MSATSVGILQWKSILYKLDISPSIVIKAAFYKSINKNVLFDIGNDTQRRDNLIKLNSIMSVALVVNNIQVDHLIYFNALCLANRTSRINLF